MKLWAFDWVGGGYNQVYATTREGAYQEVDRMFGEACGLYRTKVLNLRVVSDEQHYWATLPVFD